MERIASHDSAATNTVLLNAKSQYASVIATIEKIASHTMNHPIVTIFQILYLVQACFVFSSSPCFAALRACSGTDYL